VYCSNVKYARVGDEAVWSKELDELQYEYMKLFKVYQGILSVRWHYICCLS